MQQKLQKKSVSLWLLTALIITSIFLANCGSDEEEPTAEPPTPTQVVATATPLPTATSEPTATPAPVEPTATVEEKPVDASAQAAESEPYPAPNNANTQSDTTAAAASSDAQSATAPVAEEAYPPPGQADGTTQAGESAKSAPAAQNAPNPYPAPNGKRGPDFTIDPATKASDTVVRGTGPAGVSIRIVNASYSGDVLGTGKIGEDGKFEIEVEAVPGGDRLGIMLEDLSGTDLKPEDFVNNENYRDLPMVGLLVAYFDVPR